MTKLKIYILTILSFFLLEFSFACQTITWTGEQSEKWNRPQNWDTHTVPGACDTVIIKQFPTPNFFPVIQNAGNITELTMLKMEPTTTFTIEAENTLEIGADGGTYLGILNEGGIIHNYGTIVIHDVIFKENLTYAGDALVNFFGAQLHNYSSGNITINNTGRMGIINTANSIINNLGSIFITDISENALYNNYQSFTNNYGTIFIQNIGSYGILNTYFSEINNFALIDISFTYFGLFNHDHSRFTCINSSTYFSNPIATNIFSQENSYIEIKGTSKLIAVQISGSN